MATVTVTATYRDGNNVAMSGRVVFRLAETCTDGTVIYADAPVGKVLDGSGALSVVLQATDGMTKTMSYEVTEKLNGQPPADPYFVQLPAAVSPVNLATLKAYATAPTPVGTPHTHGEYLRLPTVSPPANTPAVWLSNRLQDMTVSPDPGERAQILTAGGGFEGTVVQEPQVFYDGGKYHMYYSCNGTTPRIAYAYCAGDPTVAANWVKPGAASLGQGTGGEAGKAYHSGVYVEGSTIYVTYTSDTTIKYATANLSTPGTLTYQGVLLTLGQVSGSPTQFGNSRISKDGSTYFLDYDCNADNWQTGYATASAVGGAYTNVMTQGKLQSLWPGQPAAGGLYNGSPVAQGGNVHIVKEGTGWVAYYHAGPKVIGSIPTDGYKATSTDRQVWTPLHNGLPFMRRAAFAEVDQVADLCPVQGPSGSWYLFTTAYWNAAAKAAIMVTPLRQTHMQYDGISTYQRVSGADDAALSTILPGKSSLTVLASDFTTASTSFVDVLTAYHYPSGPAVVVDLSLIGTNGTTTAQWFQIVCVNTSTTKPVGKMQVTSAAAQMAWGGKVLFTGLTPALGSLFYFKVQVKVQANTFYCRPTLNGGTDEQMTVEIRDATWPIPAL
jgi:hypothetical protein